MSLQQVWHKSSIQVWSKPQADVDHSEGHLAVRKTIEGCVPNSMQLWPSLHWRDHQLIGYQDEGASGCL